MKIAMVSPYALNRHGGAQGQAVGLARSLRRLGHEVVVVGPADPDPALGDAIGDHFVVGHPTGVPTNGSVAPVALSPPRRCGPSASSAPAASTWCTCTSRWPR